MFSNASLNGIWFYDDSSDHDVYLHFNGDGIVNEFGAFSAYSPAGYYRVFSDGSFSSTLYFFNEPPVAVTGQLTSSSTATIEGNPTVKINDLSLCQGSWNGTLAVNGGGTHNVTLTVNSTGEITSFTLDGISSFSSGKMFSEAGKVVSHLYTNEPDTEGLNQININGTLIGDTINGTLQIDNGSGDDGTVSLSR